MASLSQWAMPDTGGHVGAVQETCTPTMYQALSVLDALSQGLQASVTPTTPLPLSACLILGFPKSRPQNKDLWEMILEAC